MDELLLGLAVGVAGFSYLFLTLELVRDKVTRSFIGAVLATAAVSPLWGGLLFLVWKDQVTAAIAACVTLFGLYRWLLR